MDMEDIGSLAADYEFFGEAAPLMDMQVLKGHGIAALGGAGGALLTEAIFNMDSVAAYFNGDGTAAHPARPGYRALAQLLLGIAGARAIYHFEGGGGHPAAYGFAGQVAGSAAAGGAMMLYHQYATPAGAPAPVHGFSGGRRAMYGLSGETEVIPVQPYYDRYKTSVPGGSGQAVMGLSGEEVTRANYLQTNGLGQFGEDAAPQATAVAPDQQPLWPQDDETPDVGTWIG